MPPRSALTHAASVAAGVMLSASFGSVASAQELGPCDIVVKDTLSDPANWTNDVAAGGFVTNTGQLNDTRSFIGFKSLVDGCIRDLSFVITISDHSTMQPLLNDPIPEMRLDVELYQDIDDVIARPESQGDIVNASDLGDWFSEPAGQTIPGSINGFSVNPGSIWRINAPLASINLSYPVTKDAVQYLGLTTISVPTNKEVYLQRSLDGGFTIGGQADWHRVGSLVPTPAPIIDLIGAGEQNATRIVVGPCDGTCCPADRSTSGAMSEADTGWGVPDGILDEADQLYFVKHFSDVQAGALPVIQVDRNGDGSLDFFDVIEFLKQFDEGCP